MISAREIADLARDVQEVQPTQVAIRRATSASDGLGGVTHTYTTLATVQARVTPLTDAEAERVVGDRVRSGTVWKVAMPAGTQIRTDDRVMFGNVTYAVEAVKRGASVEVERVAFVVAVAA